MRCVHVSRLGVLVVAVLCILVALASVAAAQLAVSANDNKVILVNGTGTVVQNPPPDTVAIIDLKPFPPKVLAEIDVPTSVVGPPLSVAITPNESLRTARKERCQSLASRAKR
jgi:hypothetical protein